MPTKYDGQKSDLPTKPIIDPTLILYQEAEDDPGPYNGPIEQGMVFAWEPWLPYARQLVIVAYFDVGGHCVYSYNYPATPDGYYENYRQNSASRFRKSVIPTTLEKIKIPKVNPEYDPLPPRLQARLNEFGDNPNIISDMPLSFIDVTTEVARVWLDSQYPWEFNNEPRPHRHFAHALLHVFKACGKLSDYVDARDHGCRLKDETVVAKALADIVISTQRMAQKADVNLGKAVQERLATLRERYHTKPLEDNSRYEDSARIMFEEIYPDQLWTTLTPETRHNWREIACHHFVRTTEINVIKSSSE